MADQNRRSNTKACQPFQFCAQLCLLTAAVCGAQCGACQPDITYFAKDNEVIRKRRKPKQAELSSSKRKKEFSFQLDFRQRRTAKHKKQWNTDSGATISVTDDPSIFRTVDEINPDISVQVANGNIIRPTMRGSIDLNMSDSNGRPYTIVLSNVYYHPDFAGQLLSVDQLWEQHRIATIFRGKRAQFITNDGISIPIRRDPRRRYMVDVSSVVEADASIWHRRFMHVGNAAMHRMGCVIPALAKRNFNFSKCHACLQGGARKLPFAPAKPVRREKFRKIEKWKYFGHRIAVDLCGPFPNGADGDVYTLSFIDSKENYVAVYTIPNKEADTVRQHFEQFLFDYQDKLTRGVGIFWSDNGSEFCNRDMDTFLQELCTRRALTVPYTPQQNPAAERMWGILLRKARTSMCECNADDRLWPYFIKQAALIHNIQMDDDCSSPYERVHGERFDYNKLHAMGCLCYYLLPERDRGSKLSPRALPAIYLGTDLNRNGHYVYVPGLNGRLTSAYHVIFNEHRFYHRSLDPSRVAFENDPADSTKRKAPARLWTREYSEERDEQRTAPNTEDTDEQPEQTIAPDPVYTRLEHDLEYHPANDPRHGTVSTRTERGEWSAGHCPTPLCTKPSGHSGLCTPDIVRSTLRPRPLPTANPVYPCCRNHSRCTFYDGHSGDCVDRQDRVLECQDCSDDGEQLSDFEAINYSEPTQFSGSSKLAEAADDWDSILDFDPMQSSHSVIIDDVQHEVLHVDKSLLGDTPCPKQFKDVLTSALRSTWFDSMQKEITALLKNKTWNLVSRRDPRLRKRKPTKSRWVYTIKYNRDGTISRYKSRFVVCGYSQRQGVDYDRAFSATLRATTFRTLLAISAGRKLRLRQIDVSNAFTQAHMDDVDVFVEPPQGFEDWECCSSKHPTRTGQCKCGKGLSYLLHLKRALYGTKQASRLWQGTLCNFLVNECSFKFKQSKADPCLFSAAGDGFEIICGVYVDDIILAYRGEDAFKRFEGEFRKRFESTPSEPLKWFLGMAIDQHEDFSIHVGHELSIQKMADKFIPQNTVTRDFPSNELFSKLDRAQTDVERAVAQEYSYASLVGALLYISVMSRPDVAYHTSILAKFLHDPSPDCYKAALQLLQYLHSTKNKRMYFSGKVQIPDGCGAHAKDIEQNCGFVAYSDSLWGNKYPYPMFGYGIYLYGGLISYASKQLKTVAFSSCEAEYAAASYACKEIEFVRNVCADMGVILQGRLVLCVDNTAAIDIAHDVGVSARTKHFDRAIHYLRDLTQLRRILPLFVDTHRQRADGYTKALDKSTFNRWVSHVVH